MERDTEEEVYKGLKRVRIIRALHTLAGHNTTGVMNLVFTALTG